MFQVKRIEKGKKEMKREEGEGTIQHTVQHFYNCSLLPHRPKETI